MSRDRTASRALVVWCLVLECSLSMTAARSSFASAEPQIAPPVLGRYVRVELATEADNVTHLYLEPRLVKAGEKHCYSPNYLLKGWT